MAGARTPPQAPHVDRDPLEDLAAGLQPPSVVRGPLTGLPPVVRGPLAGPLPLPWGTPWGRLREGAASHECTATRDELLQGLAAKKP